MSSEKKRGNAMNNKDIIELQQYRNIGTPDELLGIKSKVAIFDEYRQIGSVEEFRELKFRSKMPSPSREMVIKSIMYSATEALIQAIVKGNVSNSQESQAMLDELYFKTMKERMQRFGLEQLKPLEGRE